MPELTREQLAACDHSLPSDSLGGRHAFEWPRPHEPRNVWNPYAPACSRCGKQAALDMMREADEARGAL